MHQAKNEHTSAPMTRSKAEGTPNASLQVSRLITTWRYSSYRITVELYGTEAKKAVDLGRPGQPIVNAKMARKESLMSR